MVLVVLLSGLTGPLPSAQAGSLKGIDISHWKGDVDFRSVRADGIQYVYVKATEGSSYTDPMFAAYVKNARAAGMPVGAYHYARPTAPLNLADAQRQALYFINVMRSKGLTNFGDLMPVLDLEEPASPAGLTGNDLAVWSRTFVDTVQKQTNRRVLLYTGSWFIELYGGFNGKLADLPLWVADYQNRITADLPPVGGWSQWTIWQYTDQGVVNGILSPVQMNTGPASLEQIRGYRPPTGITGITAASTSSSILLSWSPSLTAERYMVTRNGIAVYQGTATSFKDTKVQPGTYYKYTFTAYNKLGSSSPVIRQFASKPLYLVKAATARTAYPGGHTARTTVSITKNGKPLADAKATVTITSPSGAVRTVTGRTDAAGSFAFLYVTARKPIGTYKITAKASLNGMALGTAVYAFKTTL